MFYRIRFAIVLGIFACACVGTATDSSGAPQSKATQQSRATSFATLDKAVRRAALARPAADVATDTPPPLSLTASDGTGLKLVSLKAKAVVEGPLAFTELHLTFRNPESRVREGRFRITLAPTAAISRFAMKLPSGWQEAEVIERKRAQRVYEDFLHRRQDPALLEKEAGNQFSARVFPIPAKATKELIIAYSQKLVGQDESYVLPLRGLSKMRELSITAMVGDTAVDGDTASSLGGTSTDRRVVEVNKTNYTPDQDFVVTSRSKINGLASGNLRLVRVRPKLNAGRVHMHSLLVLFDTSASRAAGFTGTVTQLGEVLAALHKRYGDALKVKLACFDQTIEVVFNGHAGQVDAKVLEKILARRAFGASNLHATLRWAQKQKGIERILLVTDGLATAGKTERAALRKQAKVLSPRTQRLDVLLVGGIRDDEAMATLVHNTVVQEGVVIRANESANKAAHRISHAVTSGIEVKVDGARWAWPNKLHGVQPGDDVLVFAEMNADHTDGAAPVRVFFSGPIRHEVKIRPREVTEPLLKRASIEARIAQLERRMAEDKLDPDMRGAMKKQIIELSTKHRVLSDYTALLVLETGQDYARYGIERNALADILVVGVNGVALSQRKAPVIVRRPRPMPTRSRPAAKSGRPGRSRSLAASGGNAEMARPAAPPIARSAAQPAEVAASMGEAADGFAGGGRGQGVAVHGRGMATRELESEERGDAAEEDSAVAPQRRRAQRRPAPSAPPRQADKKSSAQAVTGELAKIQQLIKSGRVGKAVVRALKWTTREPGNVLALIALGEALTAQGHPVLAARVYGSIIDLFPSRADLRRMAGERLEALGRVGLVLAADTYAKAVKQRPDHPSGHRLLAFAAIRLGQFDRALSALEKGIKQRYIRPFPGVDRILREDIGLVAAAAVAKAPKRKAKLAKRLAALDAEIATQPSLRFVMNWESDANDVDFHIYDGKKNHAYYSATSLPTGGTLFGDVTTGYGPECFAIPGKAKAFPYRLEINYYRRGPMGYGMGKVQVVAHDGKGNLRFEDRPFVVMNDHATVPLGVVKRSLF